MPTIRTAVNVSDPVAVAAHEARQAQREADRVAGMTATDRAMHALGVALKAPESPEVQAARREVAGLEAIVSAYPESQRLPRFTPERARVIAAALRGADEWDGIGRDRDMDYDGMPLSPFLVAARMDDAADYGDAGDWHELLAQIDDIRASDYALLGDDDAMSAALDDAEYARTH